MPNKANEGTMYKPKCKSLKPQDPKDIIYTHCEKDQGHTGDHYGNDTANHLLDTSLEVVMVSWPQQMYECFTEEPEEAPPKRDRFNDPRYLCPRCLDGTAAHE